MTNQTTNILDWFIGKTFNSIVRDKETIVFESSDGKCWMGHRQECCECVEIEDICGDIDDLIGSPIIRAEERIQEGEGDPDSDTDCSATWSFYEFATINGSITIRWYGTSNGWYSERVDLLYALPGEEIDMYN